MSAATQLKERVDVYEIAGQALEQARGDAYKATQILEEHARKDVNLANELLFPLLHQACYDAVRKVCIRERGYVARQADNVIAATAQDNARRVKSHATRLMSFTLPYEAKPLGEATRDEVLRNSEFYQKQARTELQRARWLALVAERLQGRKKVKNAMTEDDLMRLWQESQE
jgi:hypothetical protein